MNKAESERVSSLFEQLGYQATAIAEKADFIVLEVDFLLPFVDFLTNCPWMLVGRCCRTTPPFERYSMVWEKYIIG